MLRSILERLYLLVPAALYSPALRRQQQLELWSLVPTMTFLNVLNSSIIVAIFLEFTWWVWAAVWQVPLLVVNAINFVSWYRSRGKPPPTSFSGAGVKRGSLWVGFAGLWWGMAPVLINLQGDPVAEMFVLLVLCAMMAGIVATLPGVPQVSVAFTLPCLIPSALIFAARDDVLYSVLVLMIFIYTAAMVLAARMGFQRFIDLLSARAAAEEANRAKSSFLATMSHEIRTPMTAIIGMTDLMAKTRMTGEQVDLLDTVRTSARSLLTILNDILDFSKMEAGKVALAAQPFDLHQTIKSVSDMMSPLADEKGLSLTTEIAKGTPQFVTGDDSRLRQILMNLVSNAIKFTESGQVRILVRARRPSDLLCRLKITVEDTGIGIPEDFRERLFSRFSQADSSRSRAYGGTGLGLAICHELVALMDGDIDVESEEEKGSRFWIDIPVMIADAPEQDVKTSRIKTYPVAGLQVLIAEDNPVNRALLQKVLAGYQMNLVTAQDGSHALQLALKTRFDLILTDIEMPRLDGEAFLQALRASGEGSAESPVIALTAHKTEHSREMFLRSGFSDYVSKPIDQERLLDAITGVLPASQLSSDLPEVGDIMFSDEQSPPDTDRAESSPDAGADPMVRKTQVLERLIRELDAVS